MVAVEVIKSYRRVRPVYAVVLLLVAIIIGGLVLSNRSNSQPSNNPIEASNWTLAKIDGGSASLSDYRGQVVMINFWASWCGTCREEMPDIVKTYHDYRDQGLVVIGINYGEDDAPAKEFVRSYGMDFPTFFDNGKVVAAQYGVVAMPTTFLIDRRGKITNFAPGKIIFSNLRPAIEKLLAEST